VDIGAIMKKLFALLFFVSTFAFGQNYPSPTYKELTVNGSFIATGLVTTADIATQALIRSRQRNRRVASPTALAVPRL